MRVRAGVLPQQRRRAAGTMQAARWHPQSTRGPPCPEKLPPPPASCRNETARGLQARSGPQCQPRRVQHDPPAQPPARRWGSPARPSAGCRSCPGMRRGGLATSTSRMPTLRRAEERGLPGSRETWADVSRNEAGGASARRRPEWQSLRLLLFRSDRGFHFVSGTGH